jgi:hypothetical protein
MPALFVKIPESMPIDIVRLQKNGVYESQVPLSALAGDMDAIQTVLSDEQKRAFKPVAIELKKGEASFHHALLMGYSAAECLDPSGRFDGA